jgi:hypothetical protein
VARVSHAALSIRCCGSRGKTCSLIPFRSIKYKKKLLYGECILKHPCHHNQCLFSAPNFLELPFLAPVFINFGHLCYVQFGTLSKAILHMYVCMYLCMHKGYVCLMKKVHIHIKRISVDLVRITEELLEWKSSGRGNPLRWPCDTLYQLKLALTSPAGCGRSVGIVRLRTKTTELLWVCVN